MAARSRHTHMERERQARQLARRLLAEAGSGRKQRWGLRQLLAAYKIGQALNEFTTPWWWDLEIHEIDMFFSWDENEINRIAADMQCNGYDEECPPIVLFENKVLDGKMRLEAARRAQVSPRFETFDGDARDALEFAMRLNGRRRRLTEVQREVMLVEMGVES